jgi:23S rRNA pseudouridine2605 synthase
LIDDDSAPKGERIANSAPKGERIAKRMAAAGLCSRREAERWIAAGRVAVDGKTLDTPALTVHDGNVVTVDGKPIPGAAPVRMWLYHKPPGLLTTNSDPEGRPTVFAALPKSLPRVVSVGRLDMDSEGLLLLTTSGEIARKLESPKTAWRRRYRVRAYGPVDEAKLKSLAKGITVEGIRYRPIEAELERKTGANSWLKVTLSEGKNREIRRVLEHIGLKTNRLIRTAFGPFQLGNLKSGDVRSVPAKVVAEQIGKQSDGG